VKSSRSKQRNRSSEIT